MSWGVKVEIERQGIARSQPPLRGCFAGEGLQEPPGPLVVDLGVRQASELPSPQSPF